MGPHLSCAFPYCLNLEQCLIEIKFKEYLKDVVINFMCQLAEVTIPRYLVKHQSRCGSEDICR